MPLPTVAAAKRAMTAFQRFGLGPKPGGPMAIGADPLAALRAEVNTQGIANITTPGLPTHAIACREGTFDFNRAEAVRRLEIDARVDKQMSVPIGFVERMVLFWSNHFSMNVRKNLIIRSTIGQLERDVIRKHVLGKFADMLIGVVKHPAMIAYLDNVNSIGTNSIVGGGSARGYNENLAREILELHTMGPPGGPTGSTHTLEDIVRFSLMLTGWSFVKGSDADSGVHGDTQARRGQFVFRERWHERFTQQFMGKNYPDTGVSQAGQAMRDIAIHPATAEHIAFKLIQHFITDDPTPEMVDPIRTAFLNSGGNLKSMTLALLDLPAAFGAPFTKLRLPYELALAEFRAMGLRYTDPEYPMFASKLNSLQQELWAPPLPTGYSDETRYWLNPDGMTMRLDTALRVARTYAPRVAGNIAQLADNLYDRALSGQTRERIAGAGSTQNALTILFSCPEFQRR